MLAASASKSFVHAAQSIQHMQNTAAAIMAIPANSARITITTIAAVIHMIVANTHSAARTRPHALPQRDSYVATVILNLPPHMPQI